MSKTNPLEAYKEKLLAILVWSLAIFINLMVLINAILHDPGIGYDAQAHLDYVYYMPYHLPSSEDTTEYFSAPLPYLIPSIANVISREFLHLSDPENINGKTAQFVNLFLSIGNTILLMRISQILAPGNLYYKAMSLFILGSLPVYYKSFSQLRGETYVVFFVLLLAYLLLQVFQNPNLLNWKFGVRIGIVLGLLALSRQWGLMIFPAVLGITVMCFRKSVQFGVAYFQSISIAFIAAFIVAGWFYLYLDYRYGSVTAFNVEARAFSFENQPSTFYRNTGFKNLLLFKSPVRPTFDNQFFPIFYSEIWGDYWGYFVYIKEKVPSYGVYHNKTDIAPYLGRVNAVSIFPSLLLGVSILASFYYSLFSLLRAKQDYRSLFFAFIGLVFAFSITGYLWFVIKYPIGNGATIKATYLLHIFSLLPFIATEILEKQRLSTPKLYFAIVSVLAIVFVHNFPAMVTRYWWFLK